MIPDNRLFLTLICKNDYFFSGWKHFWFLSLPSRFEIYLLGFDEFFYREKSSRLFLTLICENDNFFSWVETLLVFVTTFKTVKIRNLLTWF